MIRVEAKDTEMLKEYLYSILNIAIVISLGGRIPDERDIANAKGSGFFWFRDGDRYCLAPHSNNYWAFVREEGENFIVLEFAYRYDKNNEFADTLTKLLAIRFPVFTKIVQ